MLQFYYQDKTQSRKTSPLIGSWWNCSKLLMLV